MQTIEEAIELIKNCKKIENLLKRKDVFKLMIFKDYEKVYFIIEKKPSLLSYQIFLNEFFKKERWYDVGVVYPHPRHNHILCLYGKEGTFCYRVRPDDFHGSWYFKELNNGDKYLVW